MPQSVEVEANALTPQVKQTLEQEGYSFVLHAPWGIPEGILVGGPSLNSHGPARFYGGADHRHPGGAAIGE
jgi:gamma-glutamyltranspeptidase/glutathione hydrolase